MMLDDRNRRRTTPMSPPKYYSPETDPVGTLVGIGLGSALVGILWVAKEIIGAWS
ncbi:MAG: hypothetical protein QHC67_03565 [Sphingobium sp.]|uniref:hypothetical protein n=1 Tax=Sphingobium sp. TaxID=1912891 RepID=UPI0029AF5850|nr:hypothetical protein [Sphingobium sp.]MDX3908877.1 hypothetical protein [Sphingobium sp.]